jgi:hypothetical protein
MPIIAIIAALVAAGAAVAQGAAARQAKGWGGGGGGGGGAFGSQDVGSPAAAGVGMAGSAMQGIARLFGKAKEQPMQSTAVDNAVYDQGIDSYMDSKGWENPTSENRMGDPNLEYKNPGLWFQDYVNQNPEGSQLSSPYGW